ncbi:precorrin-4/cobalt-precorrin-4 C11-methyltransferase [Rhodoligotrophos appendicifer]
MSLAEITEEFRLADSLGLDVSRLHSGDVSIWSAMGEQLRCLDNLGIDYTVTPGVPSFAAAAAVLKSELTLPEVSQSLVLTRVAGRASGMPKGENLAAFAATGAVLALHLSIHVLHEVVSELLPHYGLDCPIAIVYRASWPDEQITRGTLGSICSMMSEKAPERTAIILVGRTLGHATFPNSSLYDETYQRRFRGRAS